MDFLHWYDFVTPTSSHASIFLGIVFSFLAAFGIGLQTKTVKWTAAALITGIIFTFISVGILYNVGYYS